MKVLPNEKTLLFGEEPWLFEVHTASPSSDISSYQRNFRWFCKAKKLFLLTLDGAFFRESGQPSNGTIPKSHERSDVERTSYRERKTHTDRSVAAPNRVTREASVSRHGVFEHTQTNGIAHRGCRVLGKRRATI